MADDLPDATSRISQWAASKPEVKRVWFFGSRIRGSGKDRRPVRDDSDLDIAVEIAVEKSDGVDPMEDCASLLTWIDVANTWRNELAPLSRWPIDLQMFNDGEHVQAYVSACSVLIYERSGA